MGFMYGISYLTMNDVSVSSLKVVMVSSTTNKNENKKELKKIEFFNQNVRNLMFVR